MRDAEIAVVWDAHLGGWPVALLGIESRPLAALRPDARRRPGAVDVGHAVPARRRRRSRARSTPPAAAGRSSCSPTSPASTARPSRCASWQLEYGAEIGRAVVNFDGPIVFCVVSRYHGGAFVVFSQRLNDELEAIALEGAHASVIGGAPAAAVVFAATSSRPPARTRASSRSTRVRAGRGRRAPAAAPSARRCGRRCSPRSAASSPRDSTRSTTWLETAQAAGVSGAPSSRPKPTNRSPAPTSRRSRSWSPRSPERAEFSAVRATGHRASGSARPAQRRSRGTVDARTATSGVNRR